MTNTSRHFCTIVFLLALTACGGGASSEEHIARAHQFISDSEYDSAIIELKNALQQDDQSAEARWLLGKIYLESGDVLSAAKELRQARKLGWSRNDVIPALAQSLLAQGSYAEVRELEVKGLQPQAEASLLASKALAAMGLGENNAAKKLNN